MRYLTLAFALLLLPPGPARAVDQGAINRAVDRGVTALKAAQSPDGKWTNGEIGATALAGLTLLECGVSREDRSVVLALNAVREESLALTSTYSLALAVLFLDRYDDPYDTPLIESMVVRLLAGQRHGGGWSYTCPNLASEEILRIRAEIASARTAKPTRDLAKLPAKGKRTKADLAKETLAQLELVGRGVAAGPDGGGGFGGFGDNSNTQFATLGVWVGRRYGLPVQDAMVTVSQRFRVSQNADGGWSYIPTSGGSTENSTAAMTCAGLIGLACGYGGALDKKKAKDDSAQMGDLNKDVILKRGLGAISTAVGKPLGWNGTDPVPPAIQRASGKAYYYLWSLERVAVILNLETIDKKDWYQWGAEILLANQLPGGLWDGEYATNGQADTCFALLFLKKANLTRDLSAAFMRGDGTRVMRGSLAMVEPSKARLNPTDIGGKAAGAAKGKAKAESGSGRLIPPLTETPRRVEKPRPKATTAEEKEAVGLGDELLRARPAERAGILKKLRDTKGLPYTETLVWVISRLDGEGLSQSRVALAERFTRLTDTTLRGYLKDDEPEIRRAAALATASRGSKVLVPELIRLLSDEEEQVQRAAYVALKELTGKDFGPMPGAGTEARKEAIAAWLKWWKDNARE